MNKSWLDEWKQSGVKTIGERTIITDLNSINSSTDEVAIQCACGNVTYAQAYYVYKSLGKNKDCGKCWMTPIMNGRSKYNKLTIISSITNETKVTDKIEAKCDCGAVINTTLNQVITNRCKSCGNCDLNNIIKSGIKKFNSLLVLDDLHTLKKQTQKVKAKCDCGTVVDVVFRNLIINNSKSCGQCDIVKFHELNIKTFGNLTILDETNSISRLSQKVRVRCKCGHETIKKLYNIYSGHTKSCGRCYESIRKSWEILRSGNELTSYPITSGPVVEMFGISNVIHSTNTMLEAKCVICGNDWNPRYKDILRGASLTCGCSYNKVSTAQLEIGDFISKYANIKYEHKIDNKSFDIFIPDFSLLVEYHGLKWHSMPHSKKNDIEKYRLAKKSGLGMIVIYEDEWKTKRQIIESILKNRIMANKLPGIRPSECFITRLSNKDVKDFYEKNHYIGATDSTFNAAAIYDDEIVAAMSFKPPTRQSKYDFELVRMASGSHFRVHGIWNKLLSLFISEYNPISIVSFSDNRMFSGKIYEKLGFKYDGSVKPDYYWVDSRKRINKSSLRKPVGCNVTENELRTSQGYAKLWDCGKTRWVWNG